MRKLIRFILVGSAFLLLASCDGETTIKLAGLSGIGGLAISSLVVNGVIAWGVWQDAQKLASKGRLLVLSPLLWALATLSGSFATLALYCAVHYSTFRKDP